VETVLESAPPDSGEAATAPETESLPQPFNPPVTSDEGQVL
jgi:hypothetical protein